MKTAALNFYTWLIADPRRTYIILTIVMITVMLALAAVPGGIALAEDVTSGG